MASEISIQNNENNILMNLLQYAGFISNKMFYLNQIKDNLLKATIPFYMYMTDLKGMVTILVKHIIFSNFIIENASERHL